MSVSTNWKSRSKKKARSMNAKDEARVVKGYSGAARTAEDRGAPNALIEDAQILWRMLRDPSYSIPGWVWAWIIFALLYFINPVDLVPDAIPVAGYLDDASVVAWVMTQIQSEVTEYKQKRRG